MKPHLWLAVLPLLLPGCARDAEERHLDEMSQEIDHLQVDRDEENAKVLAAEAADTHFATEAMPARRPAPSEPPPPSWNVGDEGQGDVESPDTEDPTPRPTIRVYGSSRSVRGGAGGDDTASTFVDDSGNTTSVPSGSGGALDPAAKPAYEAAIALVSARQYDRALDALAAFLVKYPDHPYADNAMYWRGECYFAKGDYLRAAEQFEGVVTRFPAGNKAPDALLKLGMSQQKLGNPLKAKEYFDRLAQAYPQSAAARHIPPVTVPAAQGPASEDHR
ncbi:MAG TPA: tol-pal system protein YbgF [Polyangiaceae bacterium]